MIAKSQESSTEARSAQEVEVEEDALRQQHERPEHGPRLLHLQECQQVLRSTQPKLKTCTPVG